MLKKINFKKGKYEFVFRNPKLDEHGKFVMEYKIPGIYENKHNKNGEFYFNAEFNIKNKAMLMTFKVKGKKFKGVGLPEKEFRTANKWYNELKEDRRKYINEVVDALVEGRKSIIWEIVGCDYPHYQPWLSVKENCSVQDIMRKAIQKLLEKNGLEQFVGAPCEFLQNRFKQSISTEKNLNEGTFNFKFDKKSQKYYGLNDAIVTSFETTLATAMKLEEMVESYNKREAEKKAIFNKARETGKKQIIRKYPTECNDPNEECDLDIVTVYAMPDGLIKYVRQHTW